MSRGPVVARAAAANPGHAAGQEVSVVITVRNEAANLPRLLESLVGQQTLKDVVVVDAMSDDGTAQAARAFGSRLPLKFIEQACGRGEGRNIGTAASTGQLVAFTDGDCVADAAWTDRLAAAWDRKPRRIVAGKTVLTGHRAFTKLHRVELPHRGQDTTWPSCNLAYPRSLLDELGGFDPTFVTAEDIDLNFRAVAAGAHIVHEPQAIVYARARPTAGEFLKQAYWNGYGRKQLTRKHGRLWRDYSFRQMITRHGTFPWGILRMGVGLVGYLDAKRGRAPPRAYRRPPDETPIRQGSSARP